MKCEFCRIGTLRAKTITYTRVYNDHLISMPNVTAWVCDVCGDLLYDQTTVLRLELLLGSDDSLLQASASYGQVNQDADSLLFTIGRRRSVQGS